MSLCLTRHDDILPLRDGVVPAGAPGEDGGGLHHLQVGKLTHHGVSVDLAHVETSICPPDSRVVNLVSKETKVLVVHLE